MANSEIDPHVLTLREATEARRQQSRTLLFLTEAMESATVQPFLDIVCIALLSKNESVAWLLYRP